MPQAGRLAPDDRGDGDGQRGHRQALRPALGARGSEVSDQKWLPMFGVISQQMRQSRPVPQLVHGTPTTVTLA
jgi:hypothetical protein